MPAPVGGGKAIAAAAAMAAVVIFVFCAAQGFHFNGENVRAIARSFQQDNAGGFAHAKAQNGITWLGVAIRALGLPAFALAVLGLRGLPWRSLSAHRAVLIALLPLALHGLGLLAIHTTFPRHFLPLVPLLLLLAARGIACLPRGRVLAGAVCVAWSAALAWSDGAVFRRDPRESVAQELPRLPGGGIWADAYFKLPVGPRAVDRASEAEWFVLSEAWTWRFERSEINPLRAPRDGELYHTTRNDFVWYGNFKAAARVGQWETVFEAGPCLLLPEQYLYDAAWGSFEKFAGRCRLYRRGGATSRAEVSPAGT